MATNNFAAGITIIFTAEGGLSMVPSDSGDWTGAKLAVDMPQGANFGFAAMSHPSLNIASMREAEAEAIQQQQHDRRLDAKPRSPLSICHAAGKRMHAELVDSGERLKKANATAAEAPAIYACRTHHPWRPDTLRFNITSPDLSAVQTSFVMRRSERASLRLANAQGWRM